MLGLGFNLAQMVILMIGYLIRTVAYAYGFPDYVAVCIIFKIGCAACGIGLGFQTVIGIIFICGSKQGGRCSP